MSDETKMIPGGIAFGATTLGPGIDTWRTGRPWFEATPHDSLASEMQRLEREVATLKNLLAAANEARDAALERIAQMERDHEFRIGLLR